MEQHEWASAVGAPAEEMDANHTAGQVEAETTAQVRVGGGRQSDTGDGN